jgi:hypothetical protein
VKAIQRFAVLSCAACLLAVGLAVLNAQAPTGGDYNLWKHAVPCAQFCNVGTLQAYLRDGSNTPLSSQFLLSVIGASDGPFGTITIPHGASSPQLIWQWMHYKGSPPEWVCPRVTINVTQAQYDAAYPYRVGRFIGLATIPDYRAAVQYLAAHPGAAVVLTTDGYQSYSIVGLKDGKGIWLEYQRPGRPTVRYLTEAEGAAIWDSMVNGNTHPPASYMAGVDP